MSDITYVFEAPVDTVFALLTDQEFLSGRCREMGERNIDVSVSRDGDRVEIRNTRDVERELPGFAKKLYKPVNTVVQIEQWTVAGDERRGSYHIDVKGAPVKIDATIALRPHARGTEYAITYDVKCSVPLLGKKLAKFTLDQTVAGHRQELDYTAKQLVG